MKIKPTYTLRQAARMSEKRRMELPTCYTFIPPGSPGGVVKEGYYTHGQMIQLLREWAQYPAVVRFLADMME